MQLGKGLEALIPPERDRQEQKQSYPPQGGEFNAEPEEEHSLTTEAPPTIQPKESASVPEDSVYIDGEPEDKVEGAIFQIEVDKIRPNPHQPRKHFDEDSLRELATSIREFGVLQPLVISKVEKESDTGWTVYYELVAGERRLMASKIAGLHTVPAIDASFHVITTAGAPTSDTTPPTTLQSPWNSNSHESPTTPNASLHATKPWYLYVVSS